ncbi:MAG: N-acetyltransferase [Blastomonas sp.]
MPRDRDAIAAIIRAAFEASDHGHNGEVELVGALESDGDLVISLVAVQDGSCCGHVALSRMTAEMDGAPCRALGLAPLSVLPGSRRRGIGAALMEAAIRAAREQGWQAIFLLGDPGYYGKFGFSAQKAKAFASPYAGPYFQLLALDNSLKIEGIGRADYAGAFAALEG